MGGQKLKLSSLKKYKKKKKARLAAKNAAKNGKTGFKDATVTTDVIIPSCKKVDVTCTHSGTDATSSTV